LGSGRFAPQLGITLSAKLVRSMSSFPQAAPCIPDVVAPRMPSEAWCKVLSFVVRSHCLPQICPISTFFRGLAGELLSWEGASCYLRAAELEDEERRPVFDALIPRWALCSQIFADFQDAHARWKRTAARRAFALLGHHCSEAKGLFLRNWCLMERDGFECMRTGFPALEHLELQNCDFLGHANCARLFEAHPSLRSLRATFSPKAVVTQDFVNAVPRGLMALGFVNIAADGAGLLSALLERSSMEHLWLSRTSPSSPDFVSVIVSAPRPLKTLSLPETFGDANVIRVLRSCHHLELLCFWGEDLSTEAVEAEGFEVMPSDIAMRVIVRRRGSGATLAANGAFWAPYSSSDGQLLDKAL